MSSLTLKAVPTPIGGCWLSDGRPTAPIGSKFGRGFIDGRGRTVALVGTSEGVVVYIWSAKANCWLPEEQAESEAALEYLDQRVERLRQTDEVLSSLRTKAQHLSA